MPTCYLLKFHWIAQLEQLNETVELTVFRFYIKKLLIDLRSNQLE